MGPDLLINSLVTLFRIALFAGIGLSIYLFFYKLKKPLPARVLGLLLGSVLAVFIVLPDWSDVVAQQFGISRGVDMVLYVAQVLWAHMLIRLYVAHKALSQRVTELTRALTLASAQAPGPHPKASDPAQNDLEEQHEGTSGS